MNENKRGLYEKYDVQRIEDRTGKHDACKYFVLDWKHDRFTVPAVRAYADACEAEFPKLAEALRKKADAAEKRWLKKVTKG